MKWVLVVIAVSGGQQPMKYNVPGYTSKAACETAAAAIGKAYATCYPDATTLPEAK